MEFTTCRIIGACVGATIACGLGSRAAVAQTIDWEIVDRFRNFTGENSHNAYLNRLAQMRRTAGYQALIVPKANFKDMGSDLNLKQYPTSWNESGEQYSRDWVHDQKRTVLVTLKGVPKGSTCRWERNGTFQKEKSGCKDETFKNVPLNQSTRIVVDVKERASGKKKEASSKRLETTLTPKDVLIAVIGDSMASGEGNPHVQVKVLPKRGENEPAWPAIWWDTRCHRSLLSGVSQAAILLAERDPKKSVTFVNYACSGAEIKDGVLTPFKGRETIFQVKALWENAGQGRWQPATMIENAPRRDDSALKPDDHALSPQLNQLANILCASRSCANGVARRPDILIVAVGGNDIGFGEIARDLLLSNPDTSSKAALKAWRKKQEERITPGFDSLSGSYKELANAVRSQIVPNHVAILEYINPVLYSEAKGKDRVCGSASPRFRKFSGEFSRDLADSKKFSYGLNNSLYNLLISKNEGDLANWVVVELNKRIRKAAALEWTNSKSASVVSLENLYGTDGLRRGMCAKNSWFIGVVESWTRQDWLPKDTVNSYPLHLKPEHCGYPLTEGKCIVPAGNLTTGILHPNFFGHYNAGRQILLHMEKVLAAN